MLLFPYFTIIILVSVVACKKKNCYADDDKPYLLFGRETGYEVVGNLQANKVNTDKCQPVQVWMMARHGTTYPDKETITPFQTLSELRDKILENHDKKDGKLCKSDLDNLKEWTVQTVLKLSNVLSVQGYNEIYKMGERYKIRFPSILNQTFSQDKFEFRYDTKTRTVSSAFAFADSVFGSVSNVYFPEPLEVDNVIKAYDNCSTWLNDVDNNKDTNKEKKKFEDGSEMESLIKSVTERLGFKNKISLDDIDNMYEVCKFEKSIYPNAISPWCAVFSEDDLKVLEYRTDLKEYYNTGYGNDLNVKMGCPPIKDFIDRFNNIEQGGHEPQGVFYFTQSKMLQLMLTPLGIAMDRHSLTHKNYDVMKNRQWRMSLLAPYAANMAAVFFKCEEGEAFRIMFLLNEYPLNYSGCKDGLCEWSLFKEKFEKIATNCNLDFC